VTNAPGIKVNQRTREQQSLRWREELAEDIIRCACSLASEPQRREQLQRRMQVEFKDKVSTQDKECYRCNTAEHLQPVQSPTAIIYASKHAHVFMNKPDLECTSCGTRILVYLVA